MNSPKSLQKNKTEGRIPLILIINQEDKIGISKENIIQIKVVIIK